MGNGSIDTYANPAGCKNLEECQARFDTECGKQFTTMIDTKQHGSCSNVLSSMKNFEKADTASSYVECSANSLMRFFEKFDGNDKSQYTCIERQRPSVEGCAEGKRWAPFACLKNYIRTQIKVNPLQHDGKKELK